VKFPIVSPCSFSLFCSLGRPVWRPICPLGRTGAAAKTSPKFGSIGDFQFSRPSDKDGLRWLFTFYFSQQLHIVMKSGNWTKFGQIWPNLDQILPKFIQNVSKNGERYPKSGEKYPKCSKKVAKSGEKVAKSCRKSNRLSCTNARRRQSPAGCLRSNGSRFFRPIRKGNQRLSAASSLRPL